MSVGDDKLSTPSSQPVTTQKKKLRRSPGAADCDGSVFHPQDDRGVVTEHWWNHE